MSLPHNPVERPDRRVDDLDALKGLAHPLRVAIYDTLTTFGPATSSSLAERLGESSGATSYHLRQLAKHGFVREVEGRGTARERWWERMPGRVTITSLDFPEHSAGEQASRLVGDEMERNRALRLREFVERGSQVFSREWLASTTSSTANIRLTREQTAEVARRLQKEFDAIVDEFREFDDPGSRPVQLHLNVFPVVGGDVTPGTPS